MKKVLGIVCGVLVGGFLLYQIPFVAGHWSNKVEKEIGTEYKDIKREQFEHSKSYVQGKQEDLQRYKRELERTKDVTERKVIINNIQDEFASFDETLMSNTELKSFLQEVRTGMIK